MTTVNFWNGNKSSARQGYETELLQACLAATATDWGPAQLHIDNTDYPRAEDEGNIFSAGADILVTVAGNQKFKDKQKIILPRPLAKGLLGYRLIITRTESLGRFQALTEATALQALAIGIPATWADAEIFRQNSYNVVERGSFDDLFQLLKTGAFDYTSLGANEIEAAFAQRAEPLGGLSIEPTAMIYYPLPLVFYVNPAKPDLAKRVEAGLTALMASGEHDALFRKNHGDVVQRLGLKQRKVFTLCNPFLPPEMADFTPTLLD